MEPTGTDAPDVVASAQRLLELLESLSADLAHEPPDTVGAADDATDVSTPAGSQRPAVQEDQAITRGRSSLARKRSTELASRLEQASRQARQVIQGAQAVRREPIRPASETSAGLGSGPVSDDHAARLRATLAETARRLNRTRTAARSPEEMLHSIVAAALSRSRTSAPPASPSSTAPG